MKRRLAAILAADTVGYTSLMGQDEFRTHSAWKSLRQEFIEPLIARHQGRVVKLTGDGFLVEFASVVDAVVCANEWQESLRERAEQSDEGLRLTFRIGINLGDILFDENDIYGDSVNLAVRLEGVAEPGGITLSEAAYRQVRKQLKTLSFEYLGALRLKGFTEDVPTYRVQPAAGPRQGKNGTAAAAANPPAEVPLNGEAQERLSGPIREGAASTRPHLIVLPFENFGGDPEQDYLCHGLSNDLTTDLSKFSSLSVVSSTTALTYEKRRLRARMLSQELGVRYILEGSIQKTKERIRVNVQLIEAPTDRHLWARRFDRPLLDIFALQDEIIEQTVAGMALKIEAIERERVMRHVPDSFSAYDAFLRGAHHWLLHLGIETRDSLLSARQWLTEATRRDANYGRAWAWLALTYIHEWLLSWSSVAALEHAGELVMKAISLDAGDYNIHWIFAYYSLHARDFSHALHEYQTALSLNRNDANLLAEFAEARIYMGEIKEGMEITRQAMGIYPEFPEWYQSDLAWAMYLLRDYEGAVDAIGRITRMNGDAYRILAACHAQLAACHSAREEHDLATRSTARAKESLSRFLHGRTNWSIGKETERSPYKRESDLAHWLDGLRRAGLQEATKG